jgi:hypothetical protein
MSKLSRRSVVASAAALPALTLPAVANALPPTADKVVEIAAKMLVEYDHIGGHGRDIEPSEWELYDSLDAELWEIPATSINDLAAKARVLDQRLRTNGEGGAHSDDDRVWDLIDELLAMGVQS